jgi:hypothetical protein
MPGRAWGVDPYSLGKEDGQVKKKIDWKKKF